ncbi:MAG: hypothetical protein AAGC72_13945 [Planctomycetota bacterium]
MNPGEFKKLVKDEPFRPFRMYYPSGRTFEIESSDQVLFSSDLRTIVVPDTSDDTFDILDVIMIERIETLPKEPKPRLWWTNTNGH